MGTFTVTLKRAIDLTGGTIELVNGVSKLTGGHVGLDAYPIYDEAHRDKLTGMIVDHYLMQEIGHETVDMFALAMRRKLNEIMPYYNQMYESTKIAFDPLSTMDINSSGLTTARQHVATDSNSVTDTNTDSKSRAVSSDTPQTMLSGSEDYASSAADSVGNTSATGTGDEFVTSDSDDAGTSENHSYGYQGSASALLMQYRESIVNIDLAVITELAELFMLVWNTGDTYTERY